MGHELMDCHTARTTLSAPEVAQRAAAQAHLAACPACRDRLADLAAAALRVEAETLSCAECTARLASFVVMERAGGDAAAAHPLVAAHLAVCPRCAADHAAVTVTLASLSTDRLAQPPGYPEPDLSFLPAPAGSTPWLERLGLTAPGRPAWLPWAVAGGAAVVLLLAAMWTLTPGGTPRQAVAPGAGGTATAGPPTVNATAVIPATETAAATVTPAVAQATSTVAEVPSPSVTAAPAEPEPREPTQPPAPAIALGDTALVAHGDGLLRLQWSAPPLAGNAVFDVRVCHGAGCQPSAGLTNVREASWVWCPNQGAGTYRWQVAVIDGETKVPTGPASAVGTFDWPGGSCADTPREKPTPDYTPTPGPEP